MRGLVPGLAVAILAAGVAAGANLGPQRPFRSGVDLVALDVCVKDRSGRLLPFLTADDFQVFEDNEPQRVSMFVPEARLPLAVALLIDHSGSMAGEKMALARDAAAAFLDRLDDDDEVAVVAFSRHADVRVPLGRHDEAARRAIESLTPGGQTALYEAVVAGLRELERAERARPRLVRGALVVLSDGEDTMGRPAYDYVREEARRSGMLVYVVSLRFDARGRMRPPLGELRQLAEETGGRAVAVASLDRLVPVYEEIATELRHFYRLGYAPSKPTLDGEWRTIAVRVAARPDAVVRTRAGYYARAR